eukprot:295242-Chlamydomonas_euryale.AAC.5
MGKSNNELDMASSGGSGNTTALTTHKNIDAPLRAPALHVRVLRRRHPDNMREQLISCRLAVVAPPTDHHLCLRGAQQ